MQEVLIKQFLKEYQGSYIMFILNIHQEGNDCSVSLLPPVQYTTCKIIEVSL